MVMETLSHKFIEALAGPRDRLYGLALAGAGTPAGAEAALQRTAREVFCEVARDVVVDVAAAMEKALTAAAAPGAGGAAAVNAAEAPMPADVWARLAAAVQVEAARSSHAQALNPDSVLLQPDPMLAPKKTRPRGDDAEFDVSSPARLMMLLGGAVLVGLVVTLYIMTRPGAPRAAPAPGVSSAPAPPPLPTRGDP